MYRKVVFAYDPEGLADRAVPAVISIVEGSDAEVLLVCVRDDMREFEPVEALDERARSALRQLTAAGVRARGEMLRVYSDSIPHALLDRIREYQPDLVVLGSHGRGDLAALLLGSVAHRVAAGLTCQVMIVRGGDQQLPKQLRRILVAIDPSHESLSAVRTVRPLAVEHRAEVRIFHVLEMVEFSDGFTAAESGRTTSSLMDQAKEILADGGIQVTTRIVNEGSVPNQIVKQADEFDADLIVLGSHRHGSAGGLLLGSVAHSVIARSQRPVLLAEKAQKARRPVAKSEVTSAEPTGDERSG